MGAASVTFAHDYPSWRFGVEPTGSTANHVTQRRAWLSKRLIQPDANNVIRLKLVGDSAVTAAANHGCEAFAAFDEIFSADRVIEALT